MKSFEDAQEQGAIEEKENNPAMLDQGRNCLSQSESNLHNLSQKSASKVIRECPQTPVGRLPLSELIASTEDINGQGLNTTPIERVLWNHSQQAKISSSSEVARIRKRRHSSTPLSSSQNETSNHFDPEKPSIALQPRENMLKTPRADPAADLWSRYSLNTDPSLGRLSPRESASASFVLQYSSPQTPAEHPQTNDFGGLRRSISCGMEWPTSASKRRKKKHNSIYQEANLGFAVPDPGRNENGKSKMARVSILVDEIQKGLARPKARQHEQVVSPSSSSPLPDNVAFPMGTVRPRTGQFLTGGGRLVSETHDTPAASPIEERYQSLRNGVNSRTKGSKIQRKSPSSDFDDEDLDLVILKNIDEDAMAAPPPDGSLTEPPRQIPSDYGLSSSNPDCAFNALNVRTDGQEELAYETMNSGKVQESQIAAIPSYSRPCSNPCPAATQSSRDEFDEFDEADDDIFMADIEDFASKYDIKPQNQVEQATNPAVHSESPCNSQSVGKGTFSRGPPKDEVPSDDEFGGDVDFEEIVAECEEASQRPQLASQFQSSVRATFFGPPL